MPDAGSREAFFRRNVEIEARNARSGFCLRVKKVDAQVSLVRGFVTGESRISINAEHRAAHRTGIGNQMGGNSMQPRSEITDEAQGGVADLRFVSLLVRREPIAIVVLAELAQERERLGGEIRHQSRLRSS